MTLVWRDNNHPDYYPGGHSASEAGSLHLNFIMKFDRFDNELFITVTEYVDGDAVEYRHFETSAEAFGWMKAQLEKEKRTSKVFPGEEREVCVQCGRVFFLNRRGRTKLYCSDNCRQRAKREREKTTRLEG